MLHKRRGQLGPKPEGKRSLASDGRSAFRSAVKFLHPHFVEHLGHQGLVDIFGEDIRRILGTKNFLQFYPARADDLLHPQICGIEVANFPHTSTASDADRRRRIGPNSEFVIIAEISAYALDSEPLGNPGADAIQLGLS